MKSLEGLRWRLKNGRYTEEDITSAWRIIDELAELKRHSLRKTLWSTNLESNVISNHSDNSATGG